MTVWKYALDLVEVQELSMPVGATVLHVDEQFGVPCMWALVDPDAEVETRRFGVVGTGHPAPALSDGRHVGTFLMRGGEFVWHVFEELPA